MELFLACVFVALSNFVAYKFGRDLESGIAREFWLSFTALVVKDCFKLKARNELQFVFKHIHNSPEILRENIKFCNTKRIRIPKRTFK